MTEEEFGKLVCGSQFTTITPSRGVTLFTVEFSFIGYDSMETYQIHAYAEDVPPDHCYKRYTFNPNDCEKLIPIPRTRLEMIETNV